MTLGSHQAIVGKDQARFTPRWIVDVLGRFDTDASAGDPRPFDIGRHRNVTAAEDSLSMSWDDFGRVWLNPPFDSRIVGAFVAKMIAHAHGTLLLHARTETSWFAPIWERAHGMLFLRGRVNFLEADGSPICIADKRGVMRPAGSGAPVVLSAFGAADCEVLAYCGLAGKFVPLIVPRSVMAAFGGTWREAIEALAPHGEFHLDELYRRVLDHPVARRNGHPKAKVRQIVQGAAFERTGRGRYRRAGAAGSVDGLAAASCSPSGASRAVRDTT